MTCLRKVSLKGRGGFVSCEEEGCKLKLGYVGGDQWMEASPAESGCIQVDDGSNNPIIKEIDTRAVLMNEIADCMEELAIPSVERQRILDDIINTELVNRKVCPACGKPWEPKSLNFRVSIPGAISCPLCTLPST